MIFDDMRLLLGQASFIKGSYDLPNPSSQDVCAEFLQCQENDLEGHFGAGTTQTSTTKQRIRIVKGNQVSMANRNEKIGYKVVVVNTSGIRSQESDSYAFRRRMNDS